MCNVTRALPHAVDQLQSPQHSNLDSPALSHTWAKSEVCTKGLHCQQFCLGQMHVAARQANGLNGVRLTKTSRLRQVAHCMQYMLKHAIRKLDCGLSCFCQACCPTMSTHTPSTFMYQKAALFL